MAGVQFGGLVRYLRRITGSLAAADGSDAQLLERFASRGDEAAFETLVRRHGPIVLGVCRRVLDDRHDAEDAFQATFLVLLRSAAAIRRRESLASWLYGVAHRTALKARARAAQRQIRERQARPMAAADPLAEVVWRDLRPVLDEELQRLPEKYRAPVILCYFEGKTNEDAAQLLGWTKGTVSGRLARARELLRSRLARRGLALSTGAFVAALPQNASAEVPALLTHTTVKAATAFAAGQTAALGVLSTSVAGLAEGVVKTMLATKLKWTAAAMLAFGLVAMTAGWLSYQTFAGEAGSEDEPSARAGDDKGKRPAGSDQERIQGIWTVRSADEAGKPMVGPEWQQVEKVRFEFKGKKLRLWKEGDKEAQEGSYELHPDRSPKEIEMRAQGMEEVARGLYAFEGKELLLCVNNEPGGEEPTELKSKPGTHIVLFRLERQQDGKGPGTVLPIAPRNRVISRNNLKQIGLALLNYQDTYKHFPPAALYSEDGKPLLSWRVLILPWIEQDNLYRQFKLDEPWDSPNNKPLLAQMPKQYALPGIKTKIPHATFTWRRSAQDEN